MKTRHIRSRFVVVLLALLLAFGAGGIYAVAEDYWNHRSTGQLIEVVKTEAISDTQSFT